MMTQQMVNRQQDATANTPNNIKFCEGLSNEMKKLDSAVRALVVVLVLVVSVVLVMTMVESAVG